MGLFDSKRKFRIRGTMVLPGIGKGTFEFVYKEKDLKTALEKFHAGLAKANLTGEVTEAVEDLFD